MSAQRVNDKRRSIMEAANARGLTAGGARVMVGGCRDEFAKVAIVEPGHPFRGWSTTYAWATIELITNGSGVLA